MTDPTSDPRPSDLDEPLHPLDELASAHLDGLADPAAIAEVRHDPDFTDRLNRIGRARAVVRGPLVEDDTDRREAAIAAALAEFDRRATSATGSAAETLPTGVTSLQVAAARRSIPARWRVIAVAAAVAAGAIAAVPLLTNDDNPADDTFAAGQAEAADETEASRTMGDADTSSELATEDSATTEMAAPAPGLGDFPTYDELANGVRAQLEPSTMTAPADAPPTTIADNTTTTVPGSDAGSTAGAAGAVEDDCPPPSDEPVVYEGDATVEGQPVTIEVVEEPDGDRKLEVRDPAGNCDVVDSRDL